MFCTPPGPAAALAPYARHRHRFALEVADLDRDALAAPSRCCLGIEPPVVDDEAGAVATYVVGVAATLVSVHTTTVIAGVRVHIGDGPPVVAPERDLHVHDSEIANAIDALCGRGSLDSALRNHDAATVEQFGTLARILNG